MCNGMHDRRISAMLFLDVAAINKNCIYSNLLEIPGQSM